jgi:WD40 repeat protein
VQHLAWAPGETAVLSCSIHLRLWDAATGSLLREFAGHADTVRSVEWSPDGQWIVSASHDRTVRVWEASSGRCAACFDDGFHLLVSAAWMPGGRQIVSCDETGEIVYSDFIV